MPGRILADRYELRERLGSGGMAEVFLGKDRVLGRDVAAKILHPRFARDPRYVARFRREARAAAAIAHPHVVAVFDTGEDDGTRFIVMEYVRGRTLKDVIADEAPLPPDPAAGIAAAVCEGLAAAHARGLVHRDVKPANVMLDEGGQVKVTDFGIARATTSDTLTGTAVVMGTAAYLSPEQARGEPVDARSDLYSLGCVLYEMLTGAPPFTGENPVVVAARQMHDAPDPVARRNPEIPPDLAGVVMRCLEKDPDHRFRDARALRDALRDDLRGERRGVPTEPVTVPRGDTAVVPAEDPPRRTRRGRFAAILVLLVMLGFLATWAYRSATTTSPPGAADRGENEAPPQAGAGGPEEAPEVVDGTPEETYLALVDVVEEGLTAEEITRGAADQVVRRAQEAVGEHGDGDVDDAIEELRRLREEVVESAPSEIAPERARAILEAATVLEASIRDHASTGTDGSADDDRGGGDGGDGSGDDGDDGEPGRGQGRDRGGGPPGGAPPGQD